MNDEPHATASAGHSADKDTEIGQDVYRHLHRFARRLARRHGIDVQRATDYLVTGVLFTAADTYDLDLPGALELVQVLGRSTFEDEPASETLH